jgi:hypothetical protein
MDRETFILFFLILLPIIMGISVFQSEDRR